VAAFKRFKGINNQREPEQMDGDDLASCVNFMLNDAGALVSRPGLTRVWSGAAHSLTEFDGSLYFRSSGNLLKYAGTPEVVDSTLGAGATCYAHTPGALLYSDGTKCRMLEGGESHAWGISPPTFTAASTETDAAKQTHKVQVTATYMRGRYESGAATPAMVDCPANGAKVSIDIPATVGATHKAVYLSAPGGSMLRLAAVLPIGHGPAVVMPDDSGQELQTLHKTPPPPHSISAVRNGRVLVGVGQFLLYSDPFRFDLFDPIRQSIPFTSAVTMLAAVSPEVLIVGTERGVFRLTGADMDAVAVTQISDLGAVAGAYTLVDASLFTPSQGLAVVFASAGGFCLVSQDGGVTNITGDRFRPGQFLAGSSAFSRQPGHHSVVFSLRN
jgi:hypothetical protein